MQYLGVKVAAGLFVLSTIVWGFVYKYCRQTSWKLNFNELERRLVVCLLQYYDGFVWKAPQLCWPSFLKFWNPRIIKTWPQVQSAETNIQRERKRRGKAYLRCTNFNKKRNTYFRTIFSSDFQCNRRGGGLNLFCISDIYSCISMICSYNCFQLFI